MFFCHLSDANSNNNNFNKGKQSKRGKASLKSRLGGYDVSRSVPTISWAVDTTPSSYDMSWVKNVSAVIGTSTDLEKKYLRLTSVRRLYNFFICCKVILNINSIY